VTRSAVQPRTNDSPIDSVASTTAEPAQACSTSTTAAGYISLNPTTSRAKSAAQLASLPDVRDVSNPRASAIQKRTVHPPHGGRPWRCGAAAAGDPAVLTSPVLRLVLGRPSRGGAISRRAGSERHDGLKKIRHGGGIVRSPRRFIALRRVVLSRFMLVHSYLPFSARKPTTTTKPALAQ
jgi:hypothetical protein